MHLISLIAAVDEDGGMGKNNQLLCHLPADLKHFKALTLGKPIIMGRRTFDSIGTALPGRLNIVLSRHELHIEGAVVVPTLADAWQLTKNNDDVMVIGGADVFKQALPFANQLHLTRIHARFDADVFFPNINWSEWSLCSSMTREHDAKNLYDMTFNDYKRSVLAKP